MRSFLEAKLGKLGCFILIAILMLITSAAIKWILTLLEFDPGTSEEIAEQAGSFIGKTCLALLLVIGLFAVVHQVRWELKNGKAFTRRTTSMPPPVSGRSPSLAGTPEGTGDSVPLPSVPAKQNGCLKGCLMVSAFLFVLAGLGIGVIFYLASEHEKRPKQPGERELNEAEEFISVFKEKEAGGNTPRAEALADDFSRQLRITKQVLLGGSKPGLGDLTKGRFLTFCSDQGDSMAFIVQIPGLRSLSDDARLTLEEHAWSIATKLAGRESPTPSKLAIGLRGVMDYSAILEGEVDSQNPMNGLKKRHPVTSDQPLWPYFRSGSETDGP